MFRTLGSRFFCHNNQRCVAPPGALPKGSGKPIIVCSIKRTGTHALIDLILNNFRSYQRSPLYVDYDQLVRLGVERESLFEMGDIVVKTHYPQVQFDDPKAIEDLRRLARDSHVLCPIRPQEAVHCSMKRFNAEVNNFTSEELEELYRRHETFWAEFSPVSFEFKSLVSSDCASRNIEKIASVLGLSAPSRVVANPGKDQVILTMCLKLATRVLGRRSPRLNTTIQFVSKVKR